MLRILGRILLGCITLLVGVVGGYVAKEIYLQQGQIPQQSLTTDAPPSIELDSSDFVIEVPSPVLIGTFLGNDTRNYYGDSVGDDLAEYWKVELGSGLSLTPGRSAPNVWSGAGWTGQPLLVEENGRKYLLQGSYDHTLKKIDALTGEVQWSYEFDDILKGTGTVWWNPENDSICIMQGSRRGVYKSLSAKEVFSFRSVCFHSGQEKWRLNVKKGPSYSRDVDASCLVLEGKGYIGLENGTWMVFDPLSTETCQAHDTDMVYQSPIVHKELPLYTDSDRAAHGSNIVTEASPSRLRDHLYVASGSGHVYGYNLTTGEIDWDLEIGADLDGTPVVTYDSCLLISVEKQYISGPGGVMKVDPSKAPEESIVWYMPTENKPYAEWRGGVIGSVCTNDSYQRDGSVHLAAWNGIDGRLYVVRHDSLSGSQTIGPDGKTSYPMPVLVDKQETGPSISTPIFTADKVVAAGYHGVHLFRYQGQDKLELLDQFPGRYEATPIAHRGRIYIAARNGYLYCLGEGSSEL